MKLTLISIGLLAWVASVYIAYSVGLKVQDPGQTDASLTIRGLPPEKSVVEPAREAPVDKAEALEIVTSFMDVSAVHLEDALRQVTNLDEAQTRTLLAEAFALPDTDYRRARMIRELLGQLAMTAPLDAIAMAHEIGSLRESEEARIEILEVWANNDPASAVAWAHRELSNEPLRSQSSQLLAIYRGYAGTNPEAAFAAALAMPAANSGQRRLQTHALEAIIEQQIQDGGLLAAKLQVELLEEGPRKHALLTVLIDQWAAYDPEAAAAYVASLGENASSQVKAALLGEWAENDPEAAAAWLSAREVEEETLSRASTAIIRQWTRYDMAASAQWLNAQPDSPALDRAVMSYTYRAAQEDPANAMTWAESIDNKWMRERMMQHVAGSWKADDPEAFKSYLDVSNLNDEEKKRLSEAEELHGGRRWWR